MGNEEIIGVATKFVKANCYSPNPKLFQCQVWEDLVWRWKSLCIIPGDDPHFTGSTHHHTDSIQIKQIQILISRNGSLHNIPPSTKAIGISIPSNASHIPPT
jgi:hypothetical protein